MKKYKLTNKEMKTHKGFQWELGKKEVIEKKGNALCTDAVFHFYDHPFLAYIFNSIHADITEPRLFECEVGDIVAHDGTKGGCKAMTLTKELAVKKISTEKIIEFAIRSAMLVYADIGFNNWANGWLTKKDRSEIAARAASEAWAARVASKGKNISLKFIDIIEEIREE